MVSKIVTPNDEKETQLETHSTYLAAIEKHGFFPTNLKVGKRSDLVTTVNGFTEQQIKDHLGDDRRPNAPHDPFGNFAQWGMFRNGHYVSPENSGEQKVSDTCVSTPVIRR